jgi:hypothetical protein
VYGTATTHPIIDINHYHKLGDNDNDNHLNDNHHDNDDCRNEGWDKGRGTYSYLLFYTILIVYTSSILLSTAMMMPAGIGERGQIRETRDVMGSRCVLSQM